MMISNDKRRTAHLADIKASTDITAAVLWRRKKADKQENRQKYAACWRAGVDSLSVFSPGIDIYL